MAMGFKALLPVKEFCNMDENSTFRLYFKWKDEEGAASDQEDRAYPLQLLSFKRRIHKSIIINMNNRKRRSPHYPQKTRSLVIKVVEYSLYKN